MNGMTNYSFFITEGQNTQQILLGHGPGVCVFVTQKIEFRSRDAFMRPGALLSVRHAGHDYTLLVFHLASMPDPRGFGLRQDMIDRAFKFKAEIVDQQPPAERNFILLGDLSSMGLDYVYGQSGGRARQPAVARPSQRRARDRPPLLRSRQERYARAQQDTHHTWRDDNDRSNLDHVLAASHLQFTKFNGKEVAVRGWPQLPSAQAQRQWTTVVVILLQVAACCGSLQLCRRGFLGPVHHAASRPGSPSTIDRAAAAVVGTDTGFSMRRSPSRRCRVPSASSAANVGCARRPNGTAYTRPREQRDANRLRG
jgi:hypothetical protein